MRHFNAEQFYVGAECSTCCCRPLNMSPGEADLFSVDFAAWAVPIGGKGLSEVRIKVDQIHAPTPPDGVVAVFTSSITPFNTQFVGAITGAVLNPENVPLVWDLYELDGPQHGVATVTPAGELTYKPTNGWSGWDKFYVTATLENGKTIVSEIAVGTQPSAGALPVVLGSPVVSVPEQKVNVKARSYILQFGIDVSPSAVIGAIYRISLVQEALDCDCNKYSKRVCYDLTIGKC